MEAAYSDYIDRGWVVHSFDIEAYWKDGVRKKKGIYHGLSWKEADSSFNANYNALSIDTGRSNLIVLDIDPPSMEAWRATEEECGGPWKTFTEESGSGGLHVYFNAFADADINKTVAKCFVLDGKKLDIDIRGGGGVIWAAPSTYSFEGEQFSYKVLDDAHVIDMPNVLVAKLKSLLPGRAGAKRKRPAEGEEAKSPKATKRRMEVAERISALAEANNIVEYLGHESHSKEAREKVWDNRDTFIRIAFALNSVADGTSILLPSLVKLAKTSEKAEANVGEWCEKLYNTPSVEKRPGLPFLRRLKESMLEISDGKSLPGLLAGVGCPIDIRFIEGVQMGHTAKLSDYLATWSMKSYRIGLDVVQHDKPGNMHGHVWYRHNGALWVQEASCKTNYEGFVTRHLLSLLDAVCKSDEIESFHDKFHEAATELRAEYLRTGKTPQAVLKAKEKLRDDQFYRDNDIADPEMFFKLLNSKHHLMGFNNGVMDMVAMKFYKSGHVPEDAYVSYSTGYDFVGDEDGEPRDEDMRTKMQQVEEHLMMFFPREEICTLFRLVMAMAAGAASLAQIQMFLIFWGHLGSNGKTVLLNWMGDVFGPHYMKSLDPAYLTHTADPNKPQSGLMEMRGCRIARINEANPDAATGMKINNEFLKRWTGNDPIQMRGMWGHSVQTYLSAIPILVVNQYPEFSNPTDEAKLRREGLVPFESRFVDSLEVVNADAYIFLKNKNIEKTFKDLVPAFALCLVKWAKELHRAKLVIKRPFQTYEEIQEYITDMTDDEPDAEMYAIGVAARTWLKSTFEQCDPNHECPLPSETCPASFSKGKPCGSPVCACCIPQARILDEYMRTVPTPNGKAIPNDKFYAKLRQAFTVHKHIKNRHINSKDVCFLRRKVPAIEV